MMDYFSIATGVLGSIGGVLWLADKSWKAFNDRAFSALMGKPKESGLVVVCPTQPLEPGSLNTATTYEDSLAQAEIQTQLSRRDLHHEVRLHSAINSSDLQQNLILICGPVGNSITRKLFDTYKMPFEFAKLAQQWAIVDKSRVPRYHESADPNEDNAIIAVVPNPWARPDRPTRVILAAGIRGLGTWGAAVQLSSQANSLARRLKAENVELGAPWFAGVVRVRRDESRPPLTKVLEVERLALHARV